MEKKKQIIKILRQMISTLKSDVFDDSDFTSVTYEGEVVDCARFNYYLDKKIKQIREITL